MAIAIVTERTGQASPLRDQITILACGDRTARQAALSKLDEAPRGALGLPDESLSVPATFVHGYVIDRLLEVLSYARRRDPQIVPRIDALVASWDYCAVTAEERVWDVGVEDNAIQRAQQSVPSTVAGRGFAAWGLIPRRAAGRPTPVPAGDLEGAGEPATMCDVVLPSTVPWGSLAVPRVAVEPDVACEPPPPAHPASVAHANVVIAPGAPARVEALGRVVPKAVAEIGEVAIGSGVAVPHGRGVSAALFTRQAFAGKLDAGMLASWAPWQNSFARVGATWRLAADFSPDASARPTWSLGIGYDDWHPGTWSFQINQWGPVVPGDGWKIATTAAGEIAYKVPLGATLGRHFALKAAWSSTLSWSPAAGITASWKLPHAVFVSAGVTHRLSISGRPTWTYVIGRSTWAPGSLSIILANFGPNTIPHPNFISHSAVTASWGWVW